MHRDLAEALDPRADTLLAGEAGAHVAIACAVHDQVDRQHQGLDADRPGARQHLLHELPVADHVELERERLGDACRHFLHPATGRGGKDERHARRFRCPRRLHFTAPRIHARQPDRRQRNGQGGRSPEQRGGKVDLRDVGHDLLTQLQPLQVLDIAAHGRFRIGTAVDIIEQEQGQARFREQPEIVDAGRCHCFGLGPGPALAMSLLRGAGRHSQRLLGVAIAPGRASNFKVAASSRVSARPLKR